jgi:hypothetical protein
MCLGPLQACAVPISLAQFAAVPLRFSSLTGCQRTKNIFQLARKNSRIHRNDGLILFSVANKDWR